MRMPDHVADRFRAERRDGISDGDKLVHPTGNPRRASEKRGLIVGRGIVCPFHRPRRNAHARIASVRLVPWCITPVCVVCRPADFASVVTGVGHNEDALPSVRQADVFGRQKEGTGSVAESLEICSDEREPLCSTGVDVFDEDESRSQLGDDSAVLVPETTPLAGETSSLSGRGDVLTGEASTDEVDRSEVVLSDRSNIFVPFDSGPVLREHGSAERIDLHLPRGVTDAGPFEA